MSLCSRDLVSLNYYAHDKDSLFTFEMSLPPK